MDLKLLHAIVTNFEVGSYAVVATLSRSVS